MIAVIEAILRVMASGCDYWVVRYRVQAWTKCLDPIVIIDSNSLPLSDR
jgi:hypothetical protein